MGETPPFLIRNSFSSFRVSMFPSTIKQDLLSSVVVFLVALPLCMGIAIASGAPPAAGLITGIIGGIVVGLFSGCPLQVSGPAAGLAVLVYEIIKEQGMEKLGIIVLVAGLIQVVAGIFKAGQIFRSIAPSVIFGMLAGIGILIFSAQFHVMVDDKPREDGFSRILWPFRNLSGKGYFRWTGALIISPP